MKVGVLKLGARLVFGDKVGSSGGSGEAASLVDMLYKGGITDINCFTKILNKDPIPKNYQMFQIRDYYKRVNDLGLDVIFVINGSVNFFGGAEDPEQIMNYHMIQNFKGKVIYLYCDPNLSLKQIWPSIAKKEWADNWKQSDIEITRSVDVITQVHNLEKARDVFEKHVKVDNIAHYPFYKFPMMFDNSNLVPHSERKVDISYGGTFRAGRREKKIVEFYFDYPSDIDVEVFGKIKEKQFKPKLIDNLTLPRFTGPVDYNKMISKMSEAKFHVVIGDSKYPDFGMISQRAYEAIMAGCVILIDEDFDRDKVIFKDETTKEFAYVKNRSDVLKRVEFISKNPHLLERVSKKQMEDINFNEHKYTTNFVKLIKEIV